MALPKETRNYEDMRNTYSEEDVFDVVKALLNSPHHSDFRYETKC